MSDTYIISRGASCRAAKWKPAAVTWDEFLAKLNAPARTGETVAEYKRMTKEEKAEKKDVGGFVAGELLNGKRSNRTIRNRCMVTLDADKAYSGQWDDVTALCDYRMAMYSTHSHTDDAPRLRFIIPLDRTVSPDEYGAIARKLALDIGIETMDKTTYEPARLMYWPSCPTDGVYLFRHQTGPVVCADKVLAEYGPDEAWRDTTLWPCASDEAEVVRQELKLLGDPREKPGQVGLFCRAYDVQDVIAEFLPDVYEPCDTHSSEPRYTYIGGSTYGGASVYNDGQYLFSRHDTDPAGGGVHCQNAFDLVRIHKFGHLDKGNVSPDQTKRASYKAMLDFMGGLDTVKQLIFEERTQSVREDFADLGALADEDGDGDDGSYEGEIRFADAETDGEDNAPSTEAVDNEWKKKIALKPRTTEPLQTIANVELVLRNDPVLCGKFGYNEFRDCIMIRGRLPWMGKRKIRNPLDGERWVDNDASALRSYLEKHYGLSSRAAIQDAFAVVAMENSFHPIREYFKGLPEWDGVKRLDTFFLDYFGADTEKYVDYTKAVSRKWFIAAVKRVFEPGCKYDEMLVLMSQAQGLGKSTFAQIMGMGYTSDSMTTFAGKEAYEQINGSWIVEVAELDAFDKADMETVKHFLSKSTDRYRAAYAQYTREVPRQCVFFGTTNTLEFLRDRTGNRRFNIIECHDVGKDVEKEVLKVLPTVRDQIWAEAYHGYLSGETIWLKEKELQTEAAEVRERHSVQDELVGQLEYYLEMRLPSNWEELSCDDRTAFVQGRSPLELGACDLRRDVVCVAEIRCELMGDEKAKLGANLTLSRRIAKILNTMPGWYKVDKTVRMGEYGPQQVYRRKGTKEWDLRYVKDPACAV